MSEGKKVIQIVLALGLVIVGVRFFFIWRERHAAPIPRVQQGTDTGYKPNVDDFTYLKQLHPESPKDIATLLGKTVWVMAADQLPYYPVIGTRADYAHQVGVLRGATPLAVRGMIQQVEPKSAAASLVPAGDKQVLLAFTLPNDAKTYATPVGYHNDGTWTFIADQALFYDDPHTLYSWSPQLWQAIEAHKAIPGMTEQQAGLALGQVSSSDSQTIGDRTVHYANLGHPVDVTFDKNHATAVTPAK